MIGLPDRPIARGRMLESSRVDFSIRSGECAPVSGRAQILMSGENIGDRLTAAGITWGAFMGGFDDCTVAHCNVSG